MGLIARKMHIGLQLSHSLTVSITSLMTPLSNMSIPAATLSVDIFILVTKMIEPIGLVS